MGSDGGARRAQRAAERAEAERRQNIETGTNRLNQIFDSPARQGQYGSLVSAIRELLMSDLTRQKGQADRRSRFALARSGLVGGSAANDANRRLGEEFTEGVLMAENRAQGAGADLRSQDEQARSNLLQSIMAGMDATTAAQRAGSLMQTNAGLARSRAVAEGLGDVFGSTAEAYKRSEENAERRRGVRDARDTIYGESAFGR